jgi:hypothetical protein
MHAFLQCHTEYIHNKCRSAKRPVHGSAVPTRSDNTAVQPLWSLSAELRHVYKSSPCSKVVPMEPKHQSIDAPTTAASNPPTGVNQCTSALPLYKIHSKSRLSTQLITESLRKSATTSSPASGENHESELHRSTCFHRSKESADVSSPFSGVRHALHSAHLKKIF